MSRFVSLLLLRNDPPAPWWMRILGDPWFKAIHAAGVDTKRAVRWIRAHAADYGVDPWRVAGLGHSAGAVCVLMSAVTDPWDFARDDGGWFADQNVWQSGKLNACIEVSGTAAIWTFAIDAFDAPIMMFHGTADTTVPYWNAQWIDGACQGAGLPHVLYTVPDAEHGSQTWNATVDGLRLMDHGLDFVSQFFRFPPATPAARVAAPVQWTAAFMEGGRPVFEWQSVPGSTYRCTTRLAPGGPVTERVVVIPDAETHRVTVPDDGPATGFYRVELVSP